MAISFSDFMVPIFKFLCREGYKGLNIYSIIENVSYSSNDLSLNSEHVKRIINNNPDYFYQEDDIIYPKTSLRICSHPENHDADCTSLHLCKYYLLSNTCTYGKKCLYGHDFQSQHNMNILKEHRLHDLNFDELRGLLQTPCNRTSETAPSICIYHNLPEGCRKSLNCHCLHICNKFLDSKCQVRNCNKNHNINDEQVMNVLEKYGFDTNLDDDLIDLIKSVTELDIEKEQAAPSSARANFKPKTKTSEFCHYFLSSGCLRRNCKFIHSKQPYVWRYFEDQWFIFSEQINEKLENKYADPNIKVITLSPTCNNISKVDFEKMLASRTDGDILKIERLQASSSNVWIWYWRTDADTWVEMNNSGIEEGNEIIEKSFSISKNLKLHFKKSNTYAELNFQTMRLTHKSISYPVCRRPKRKD